MEADPHRQEDPWRDLGQRLRSGDVEAASEALAEIAQHRLPEIIGSLRPRFRSLDSSDWEDVAQSALLALWIGRARIVPEAFSGGYLHRIVRNRAIDLLRALKRRASLVESGHAAGDSAASPGPGSRPQPTEPPADRSAAALDRILSRFSELDRRILQAFTDASDPGEWAKGIAAELGLSPVAVRVRKHRILQRLRRMLQALGRDVEESPDEP